MNDLRNRIEGEVGAVAPSHHSLQNVYRRVKQRRWRRRVVAAAVSLTVSAGLFAGLWVSFGPMRRVDLAQNSGGTVLDGKVMDATEAAGSVWIVTRSTSKKGKLLRINPSTGRVQSTSDLRSPSGVASGDAGVWTTSFWDSTVSRIDPTTNQVIATIPLSLPSEIAPGDNRFLPIDIAVGEGAVWVSSGRGEVARIDPAANQVVSMIAVPGESTGRLAAGDGAVWVSEGLGGVYRIDPSTNEVVAKIPANTNGMRLSVDDIQAVGPTVWASGSLASPVVDQAGNPDYELTDQTAVVQIDPQKNQVVSTTTSVGGASLLIGSAQLWFISRQGTLAERLDTTAGRVAATVHAPTGERFIAVGGGALWTSTRQGNLARVAAPSR